MIGIDDNDDEVVALLRQIANNTQAGTGGDGREVNVEQTETTKIEGSHSGDRVGHLKPNNLVVVETDDLEDHPVNDDGTVTVQPGQAVPLAKFRLDSPFSVLAVGASDEVDVIYQLRIDSEPAMSPTNSPLGLINDPFSFVDAYGAALPCEKSVEYVAELSSDASGPVTLAGRLHCEVIV